MREGGARGALSYARNESAEADYNGGAAGVLSSAPCCPHLAHAFRAGVGADRNTDQYPASA